MQCYRKDKSIIIDIPESLLIFAVKNNPDYKVKIRDKEEFLNYVIRNIVEETGFDFDSGLSSFKRLLDEVAEDAATNGAGIDFGEFI